MRGAVVGTEHRLRPPAGQGQCLAPTQLRSFSEQSFMNLRFTRNDENARRRCRDGAPSPPSGRARTVPCPYPTPLIFRGHREHGENTEKSVFVRVRPCSS